MIFNKFFKYLRVVLWLIHFCTTWIDVLKFILEKNLWSTTIEEKKFLSFIRHEFRWTDQELKFLEDAFVLDDDGCFDLWASSNEIVGEEFFFSSGTLLNKSEVNWRVCLRIEARLFRIVRVAVKKDPQFILNCNRTEENHRTLNFRIVFRIDRRLRSWSISWSRKLSALESQIWRFERKKKVKKTFGSTK